MGLIAGLQVGQAFGVLLLPGFGVGSSRFQGTQPSFATRVLIFFIPKFGPVSGTFSFGMSRFLTSVFIS